MADRARGRGSSHGIDRAILETGVGSIGALLEAGARKARWDHAYFGDAAPMPSQIQSRTAGEKERFRRQRTDDQTAGGAGVGVELCAGSGTASVANCNAAQASVDTGQGALSQPTGESVGTGAY